MQIQTYIYIIYIYNIYTHMFIHIFCLFRQPKPETMASCVCYILSQHSDSQETTPTKETATITQPTILIISKPRFVLHDNCITQ